MRQINQAGFELIKSFESCVLHVYKDAVGLPTIGWGHLIKAGEKFTTITQEEADELFRRDLASFESAVASLVRATLTDNQFSALVSLAFNIGTANFKDSTLLRLLNHGEYRLAADQFGRWNKAKGRVLKGLTRRRAAERALFLSDMKPS